MLLQRRPTDKTRQGGQEAESCQKSHAAIQPTLRLQGQFPTIPPALPLLPLGWGGGGHPASRQGSLGKERLRQAYVNDMAPKGNLIPEKARCYEDPLLMATVKMSTHAPLRSLR